jgi:transposase
MSAGAKLPSTNELLLLEDGIEVQYSRSFGVGIDVHSKFIAVCIIVKVGDVYREFKRDFPTDWRSLLQAKDWVIQTIAARSDPPITDIDPFHYVLESTSTYHFPVVKALGGTPSIINPSIAGATKRKTDTLDAKRLALHDLMGVWRATFVPTTDVTELRLLITYRGYYQQMATKISNRINMNFNRFGYTVGRDGSVTRSKAVRSVIEGLLAGNPITPEDNLCPDGIPVQIRDAFSEGYREYDAFRLSSKHYEKLMVDKAKSMSWETGIGIINGDQLINILMTAPGIGEITAVLWLAQIVTPLRFPRLRSRFLINNDITRK